MHQKQENEGGNKGSGSGGGHENIQQQVMEREDMCLEIEESQDMRKNSREDFGYWENFAMKEVSRKEETEGGRQDIQ